MNGNSDENSGSSPDLIRKFNEVRSKAEKVGYSLNPDREFTMELINSLLINKERYGYEACPCRLVTGPKEDNLDIICPCDYRDGDVGEYGCCYCGLYVSEDVAAGKMGVSIIPDRRLQEIEAEGEIKPGDIRAFPAELKLKCPVFRCRVCGYLAARNSPPEKCPICGATEERFEKFIG
ncbi:ferredoxin-thioredoxin reductase catalytic domain-containing protein [Methanoplanus endosymbiosus]|uniref:ferredoxin:thioredoxin reductase n=1 Tax=Methanoplanus endosymbiosus TaxID=33865 RepID=A0A9E7TLG6_9EURY|nr:ferredoxin-thioredoxin reductase catalytic domain-containing protein [Methanoplanus endosymbiosus]UUX92326.1 ferredoxin:glutaredoxin reductase [Methanoplanus endosymbiosus]